MRKHQYKAVIYAALICLILSSTIALFVPFIDFNEDGAMRTAGYVAGIIFWVGLIAGLAIYGWLAHGLKVHHAFDSMGNKHIGMICFFSNTEAKIADIICGTSLIVNIILLCIGGAYVWSEVTAAFIFLVSFHCHYVFNGKTYQYIFK